MLLCASVVPCLTYSLPQILLAFYQQPAGHDWGYQLPADIREDWCAKYSISVRWGAEEHCARISPLNYIKKKDVV